MRLKEIRERLGVTQVKMSTKDLAQTRISQIEHAHRPPPQSLMVYAKALSDASGVRCSVIYRMVDEDGDHDLMEDSGAALKRLREKDGISAIHMARMLDISSVAVYGIEKSKNILLRTALRYAKTTGKILEYKLVVPSNENELTVDFLTEGR